MLTNLVPDRLSQWLVALVVGAILATQAFALTLYHVDRMRAVGAAESRQAAQCLAGFAQVLASASPERRKMIMQPLLFGPPPGDWGEHPPPPGSGPFDPQHRPDFSGSPPPGGPRFGFEGHVGLGFPGHGPDFLIHLPNVAGPFAGMYGPHGPGDGFLKRIEVHEHLPDGTFLTLDAPPSFGRLLTPQFAAYIGGVIAVALAGSIWAIALATRPLRQLSEAADRFGIDVNAPPLRESGPREVKQAAAAFNRMQQRLRQFVTDRTRMLAAISHDLRTPLTRMRLRAEMVEDSEQRAKMLTDLEEMEHMVGATMAFARDQSIEEKSELVAVGPLLASVLSDAHTAGQPVGLMPPPDLRARIRPRALKRALTNIVDNAVRYGGSAEITARQDGEDIAIAIADHGSGIPEAERENVLKPFYRCESSRSRETGGIGLGLSIAADTIRAHGGRLSSI